MARFLSGCGIGLPSTRDRRTVQDNKRFALHFNFVPRPFVPEHEVDPDQRVARLGPSLEFLELKGGRGVPPARFLGGGAQKKLMAGSGLKF